MVRFLVVYDTPADAALELRYGSLRAVFDSEIGQRTAQDVNNLAEHDRVRSMIFEVAEV